MELAAARGLRKHWSGIAVSLVDDSGISAVHERLFGNPAVTDVISLHYPPFPGIDSAFSGEIFINADCVLREGARRRGLEEELSLYLAHGCDHLCGASDRTRKQRARMLARESAWTRKAAALGLLAGIIRRAPAAPPVRKRRILPGTRRRRGSGPA